MGRTQIRTHNLGDGEIKRDDLNTTTAGQAVVRKIIQGSGGLTISSTGVDSGTGDVTINLPQGLASSNTPTFAGITINGNNYADTIAFKRNNSFDSANSIVRFTIDFGSGSAGVWYKIASISLTNTYSINALRFNLDYSEDGVNYAHLRGKIRFRTNTPITSNNCEWFYDVIGHSGYSSSILNDFMRVVKDVDNGSVVTWSIWFYSPESWGQLAVEFLNYAASVAPTYYKTATSGTPGATIAQSNRARYYGGSGATVIGGSLSSGTATPLLDDTYNLGSATNRWSNFYMAGAQVVSKRADTGAPTQDTDAHIFIYQNEVNQSYLVIKWNDAGTVRYRYMRLDGTTATWTHSTTLP